MNTQGPAHKHKNPDLARRGRRFNRSQDKDSVSSGRRHLSECSSESSLFKFYKPTLKVAQPTPFMDQFGQQSSTPNQLNNLIYQNKRKPRTMTSKFQYQKVATNAIQGKELIELVKQLRARNQELQFKLSALTKCVREDINKQNKPMNKLRDKTQKERIKELETENLHLKQTIQQLNSELREVRCSRLSEETNYSVLESNFEFEDQLTSNEKQIFVLHEEVRRMQIEMDFVNRRNYSDIAALKASHDKQVKIHKDKVLQLSNQNLELRKKNRELMCLLQGRDRDRKSSRSNAGKRTENAESLLQLSCSD